MKRIIDFFMNYVVILIAIFGIGLIAWEIIQTGVKWVRHEQDPVYSITAADVVVLVNSDGSADFEQTYTYDIDYINGALLWLKTDGKKLSNLNVSTSGTLDNNYQTFKETKGRQPLTFTQKKKWLSDELEVKLFYPTNENRKFRISYHIEDLITNYQDVAEFNWKVLGDKIDFPVDTTVKIYLPEGKLDKKNIRAWGHGPQNGKIAIDLSGPRPLITAQVLPNKANQFVEVYSIFPSQLTSENNNRSSEKKTFEDLKNAQINQIKQADQRKLVMRKFWYLVTWISLLLPTLLLLYKGGKHRHKYRQKNPSPYKAPKHLYSTPNNKKAALIGTQLNLDGNPSKREFSATVLDLVRRGYLELEEIKSSLFWWRRTVRISQTTKGAVGLESFEKAVYKSLQSYKGKNLSFKEMDKLLPKDAKFRKHIQNMMKSFKNNLRKKINKQAIIKDEEFQGFGIIIGFLSVVAFIVASVNQFYDVIGKWLFIVGATIVFYQVVKAYCFRYPLISYEADKERKEWLAFARMLGDVGAMNMREIGSLALWEEYLVYAVVFGKAKKVLKAMRHQFSEGELEAMQVPSQVIYHPSDFSSMSHSAGHSFNSGSSINSDGTYGGGGGFSGGSSGGGGGGGAGAF